MNRSVLVVEDESIVAMELEEQLRRLGCRVVGPVSTAAAALQFCEAEAPDLALMDIRIQGPLDGIESAQVLRQRFDVPVIYLTALADEITMQRAKVTGPSGYLLKPVRDDELRAAVEIAFYQRNLRRHAADEGADESCADVRRNLRAPLARIAEQADLLGAAIESGDAPGALQILGRLREAVAVAVAITGAVPAGSGNECPGPGRPALQLSGLGPGAGNRH